MKRAYEFVMGTLGDSMWHVGLYRDGNCLRWESFPSRGEAEKWMENPVVPSSRTEAFSTN
jgi:hypothetical protein